MIADGVGGPKDDVTARALFEKAAAQNHPAALERMGAFALEGRGGDKDATAAKAYYEKAAALGNEDAKAALKRLECPYVIKDKRGNFVTNLCFRDVIVIAGLDPAIPSSSQLLRRWMDLRVKPAYDAVSHAEAWQIESSRFSK